MLPLINNHFNLFIQCSLVYDGKSTDFRFSTYCRTNVIKHIKNICVPYYLVENSSAIVFRPINCSWPSAQHHKHNKRSVDVVP